MKIRKKRGIACNSLLALKAGHILLLLTERKDMYSALGGMKEQGSV